MTVEAPVAKALDWITVPVLLKAANVDSVIEASNATFITNTSSVVLLLMVMRVSDTSTTDDADMDSSWPVDNTKTCNVFEKTVLCRVMEVPAICSRDPTVPTAPELKTTV